MDYFLIKDIRILKFLWFCFILYKLILRYFFIKFRRFKDLHVLSGWSCFYVYCGTRGHFVTHSLGIWGKNLTNATNVDLHWSGHVIWEYIWRLMYTGETPHKCKQCDFTSIIASHLKRHYEKDACFISGYKILRSSVLNVLPIVF